MAYYSQGPAEACLDSSTYAFPLCSCCLLHAHALHPHHTSLKTNKYVLASVEKTTSHCAHWINALVLASSDLRSSGPPSRILRHSCQTLSVQFLLRRFASIPLPGLFASFSRLNHHLNPVKHPALPISSSLTASIRLPAGLLSPFCAVSRGGKPVPGGKTTPPPQSLCDSFLWSADLLRSSRQLPLVLWRAASVPPLSS